MTYVYNQIPTNVVSTMIPKKVWCDNKPTTSHLWVFSCVMFVHVRKEARKKLNFTNVICIFIGYGEETKGSTLYNNVNQQCIMINYDVFFNESIIFSMKNIISNFYFGLVMPFNKTI